MATPMGPGCYAYTLYFIWHKCHILCLCVWYMYLLLWCVYVATQTHVCMCLWRPQDVFADCSLLLHFESESLPRRSSVWQGCLSNYLQSSACLCLSYAGIRGACTQLTRPWCAGHQNTGPCPCAAGTLMAESSSQPLGYLRNTRGHYMHEWKYHSN